MYYHDYLLSSSKPCLAPRLRLVSLSSASFLVSKKALKRAAMGSLKSGCFWRSFPRVILKVSRSPDFSTRPPSWMRERVLDFRARVSSLWSMECFFLSHLRMS